MALLAAEPIDRPRTLFGDPAGDRDGMGGGPTLDDAIVAAWEGLAARAVAACPVCDGPLQRRDRDSEGRCDRCGAALA